MQSAARRRSASTARESVRRPPLWVIRGEMVQIPDLTTRNLCCSYSVASSSASMCDGGQKTFWIVFWWMITLLHWITECTVHVVAKTCVFDLYTMYKYAHNVQTCVKFVVVRISLMYAQYFDYYAIVLGGDGHVDLSCTWENERMIMYRLR